MATCEQYESWLAAAESALQALATSPAPQTVQYGDKTVTYSRANIDGLTKYIGYLQKAMINCNRTARRRVIRIIPV